MTHLEDRKKENIRAIKKHCKWISNLVNEELIKQKLNKELQDYEKFKEETKAELIKILQDLDEDKTSFEKLEISYEEKAFYDILIKVRDEHKFIFEEEKCLILAKEIKKLVDDRVQYADFFNRVDIKNQLNTDLTVLLYKSGYPPEWDEEVF